MPEWSNFPLDPVNGNAVYVSSSQGSDANDGTTPKTALATIQAGYNQLRDGFPDQLLLNRRDIWYNTPVLVWQKNGENSLNPILIGAYTTGVMPPNTDTRPTIIVDANNGTGWFYGQTKFSNLAIQSLRIICSGYRQQNVRIDPSRKPNGIVVNGNGNSGIYLEDVYLEGFCSNIEVLPDDGPSPFLFTQITVNRCVLINPWENNNGCANFYCQGTNGVAFYETAFINLKSNDALTSNWGTASGCLMSHHIYFNEFSSGLIVSGCILYNSRTNQTNRGGGSSYENLCVRGGQGLNFACAWGDFPYNCINNVVTETRNHWNGQSLGQGIILANSSGCIVSNNLLANATDGLDNQAIRLEKPFTAGTISGNVGYKWPIVTNNDDCYLSFNTQPVGPLVVVNNLWECDIAGRVIYTAFDGFWWVSGVTSGNFTYQNNQYWNDGSTNYVFQYTFAGVNYTYAQWKTQWEPSATSGVKSFFDSTRTVGTYYQNVLGGSNNTDLFMSGVAKMCSGNWNSGYMAKSVNDYMRVGFSMQSTVMPPGPNQYVSFKVPWRSFIMRLR